MSEVAEVRSMREKVERAEAFVSRLPQVDCPVEHHFSPGVYVRKMTIPAGVAATGAVHKTEHQSYLLSGHCFLTTDEGARELHAGYLGVSKPGAKRMIVTITECVLVTIHATEETDPEKLVELLTESTAAELIGGAKNRQLANNTTEALK